MKQIFLAAGILLSASSITFSQSSYNPTQANLAVSLTKKEIRQERRADNRNEVSYLTRTTFRKDYPNATNIKYSRRTNFDEVVFNAGKKTLRAYYDFNGDLIGTIQKKSFSDLPAHAQNEINRRYSDYNIVRIIRYNDNEQNDTDMILYGTELNNADNYFVELKNPGKSIVLKVDFSGNVSYFTDMK
jgi:hypothetical protein